MYILHQKPVLTIFTDASIRNNKTGWGGWAKKDEDKSIFHSGRLPFTSDSNMAELSAIHAMLLHIHISGYSPLSVPMSIQCDNINALKFLLIALPNTFASSNTSARDSNINKTGNIPLQYMELVESIWFSVQHSPVIYLKHIKGHQSGKKCERSHVNIVCDRLAKSHTQKDKEYQSQFNSTKKKKTRKQRESEVKLRKKIEDMRNNQKVDDLPVVSPSTDTSRSKT